MSKFGCTRRDFLKTMSLGAVLAALPGCISTAKQSKAIRIGYKPSEEVHKIVGL